MMQLAKQITTKELIKFQQENKGAIIDTRPVEAYNGWQLYNEKRGGHIQGAKSLPLKWTKYIDWIEIVRSKNILPEHQIVIYGYNSNESEKVARHFLNAGYTNITLYNNFVDECATWKIEVERGLNNTSLDICSF